MSSSLSAFAPPTALPVRASRGERFAALTLAMLALTVLVVAAWLKPDPAGTGTHQQLGLPACGWMAASGFPCPTCGMTTAFAAAAHASPWRAFVTQPMGAVLALCTAGFFWACLHVAMFGSQLGRVGGRLLSPRVLWLSLGVFALAWAYKVVQTRGW